MIVGSHSLNNSTEHVQTFCCKLSIIAWLSEKIVISDCSDAGWIFVVFLYAPASCAFGAGLNDLLRFNEATDFFGADNDVDDVVVDDDEDVNEVGVNELFPLVDGAGDEESEGDELGFELKEEEEE